jgi:hypothetical protein
VWTVTTTALRGTGDRSVNFRLWPKGLVRIALITRSSDREREQTRRSALGKDQGPNDEQQAGGGFPAGILLRGLGDPQDPTSVSFPFLRRMRKDHMTGMGLHFITMDVLNAPWWMDGDDARVQAYADKLVRPVYGDLVLTILRFLWSGYSPGVKNFEIAQPNWKFFEDGVAKKVWDNPSVDAVIYKPIIPIQPETAQISFDANGNYNGIMYDNRYGAAGSFIIDGKQQPNIDKLHSFWATHDKFGEDGSPYGFPRLAYCAPIFHMFRYIWDLLGRAFENSADPGPVVRFPSLDEPALDAEGNVIDNVTTALKMGTRKRSGSTIALPSETYKDYTEKHTAVPKWSIEYPKSETNFASILEFLGYLEAAKLNGLFLPEQSLTQGHGDSSSRNVAKEFGDERSASQNVLMNQIMTFIVDVFVTPVIRMVFPFYDGELSMKTIGAGDTANDLLRQVFQLVGQQEWKSFGIDMRRLAEANNFPMLDPAEQEKQLKEAAAATAQTQAPKVEPNQGRRSLVTQTGFGETSYHRLGGTINLSSDGDFVASLPKIKTFKDKTVVAHARELRGVTEKFLSWCYKDFALMMARRKDLLDQDVSKIMRSWIIDSEKLDDFVESVARIEGKIFDRSAELQLKELMSNITLEHNPVWNNERAYRTADKALNFMLEQIKEIVESGVDDNKTQKEIASDLRSELAETPDSRARKFAIFETRHVFNYAVKQAGLSAGVMKAQSEDGMILDLATTDEWTYVRLLSHAPDDLTIRREQLAGGIAARYDQDTSTILIDSSTSSEDESKYMLALGLSFM